VRRGPVLVLLEREVKDLLRDKKALAAALLVPLVLYPVLQIFSGRFLSGRAPGPAPHSILTALPDSLAGLLPLLQEEGFIVEPGVEASPAAVRKKGFALALAPGPEAGSVTAYLDGNRAPPALVRPRLRRVLGRWRTLRILAAAAENPEARKRVERFRLVEVSFPASPEKSRPGLILVPLALLLVLLSGSAFAALDLLPGEKERGTLETLLVQPLSTKQVTAAKYLALLVPGTAALVLGILSIWITPYLPGAAGEGGIPDLTRAVLLFLLSLPAALLLAALLFWTAALARSFREGQHYLLPLTLGVLVPAGFALSPVLSLGPFTACIPLLGPVLAWRAVLEGGPAPFPLVLLFLSHGAWTLAVLLHASKLLEKEEIRLGFDPASLLDREHNPPGRRALFMAILLVFGILVFSPILQGSLGAWGIPASQVLLVLFPALLLPGLLHLPRERAFPLAMPGPANLPALLLSAGGLFLFATGYLPLQDYWLPLPPELLRGMEEALAEGKGESLLFLLLAGALLPGICEEALFRGPLLFSFRAQWGEGRALLLSALLFAAAHLSVHRFLPTFAAGILFGALALKTRNILWAGACHALYNGLLILLSREVLPGGIAAALSSQEPGSALLRLGGGISLAAAGLLLAGRETILPAPSQGPRPLPS